MMVVKNAWKNCCNYRDILNDQPHNESFHSVRKLKASNTKYTWLLLGQSSVHHIIKCMKNWISNHLNLEGEFKDYACYIAKIIKFRDCPLSCFCFFLYEHLHIMNVEQLQVQTQSHKSSTQCKIKGFAKTFLLQ